MPWWSFNSSSRNGVPWQLQSNNTAARTAVVLTPRYVVGLLAFLICVDMTQVLGVLCYQLFLGTYFPWHLYPLMLNRAVELLALLCSDGHVPSVYSVAQIFLSVLSMVICIQKEPCGKFNCVAALVLYGVLLTYQIFVAVMVVKIASIPLIGDNEEQSWLQEFEGQRSGNGLSPSEPLNCQDEDSIKAYNDVIIVVEQPDGEKYAIARLLKDVVIIPPFGYDEGSSHSMDGVSMHPKYIGEQKHEIDKKAPYYKDGGDFQGATYKDVSKVVNIVTHDESTENDCLINDQRGMLDVDCEIHSPTDGNSITFGLDSKKDKGENVEISFLRNLTNEIVSLVEENETKEILNKLSNVQDT